MPGETGSDKPSACASLPATSSPFGANAAFVPTEPPSWTTNSLGISSVSRLFCLLRGSIQLTIFNPECYWGSVLIACSADHHSGFMYACKTN